MLLSEANQKQARMQASGSKVWMRVLNASLYWAPITGGRGVYSTVDSQGITVCNVPKMLCFTMRASAGDIYMGSAQRGKDDMVIQTNIIII